MPRKKIVNKKTAKKAKRKKASSPRRRADIKWYSAVEQLRPSVVEILTPDVSGTGVLISRIAKPSLCSVATAAHVIDQAHLWEKPIRIFHPESGKTLLLRSGDRAVQINAERDEAAIIFDPGDLPLPNTPPKLYSKMHFLKPGGDLGWLGFPAIRKAKLCFFRGTISAYLIKERLYLVDGVAIHGVSGGPAFRIKGSNVELMGIVTEYRPNRNTGEALPGLSVVVDVEELYNMVDAFQSLDEAKRKESVPATAVPKESPSPNIKPERAGNPEG